MAHDTQTIDDPAAAARRLSAVLDAAAVGVWEYDRSTRRVTGSAAVDALFGLTAASSGRPAMQYLALIAPEDRQMLREALGEVFGGGAPAVIRFRAHGAGGRLRWIECHATASPQEDGSPRFLGGTMRDVSAEHVRALAQPALDDAPDAHALAQRLAGVSAPLLADRTVVLLHDGADGLRVAAWGGRWEDGGAPARMDGQRAAALAVAVDRAIAAGGPLVLGALELAALGFGGAHELLVAPLVARANGLGALLCAIDSPAAGFAPHDVAAAADLAARAALSLDRLHLLDEARRAARSRDSFISVASHDLRSPLTVLLGQAQILEKRAAEDGLGPRITRSVQSIRQQSVRLDRMISALIDLSRLQAKRLVLDMAPVDVTAAVQQVVDEVQPTLARHVITVAADEGAALVIGDVRRLEQVFQSLISNAIKYSPSGGTVLVRICDEGQQIAVAVVDQGLGIAPEKLSGIFEQFQRGGEPRESGLGAGLYMAREITRLHGGTIAVESEEGAGSAFTVRLPRAP